MNKKEKKNKVLSSIDLLIVSFGAMIGWGWVVSSGDWITHSGIFGTIFGFVLGGIVIYLIGLIYAELTTSMHNDSGCYQFCASVFSPKISFLSTWFMLFGYVGVVCFEACSLPTIIAYIIPDFLQVYLYTIAGFDVYLTWLLTAIGFAILITFLNIKGIKYAARFQNLLTIVIGVVGIILIVSSALDGNMENLNSNFVIGESFVDNIKHIFSIAAVAPFFLFGFDVIPQIAEEANIEPKKIGKMLILSIILAIGFYVLVVLAIGYALSLTEINNSMNNSGLVAADAIKKMLNSSVMAKVLIFGGLCGVLTSWNSFLIGGSRTLSSLSKLNFLPKALSKVHRKYNTPYVALIVIGIISIIAPLFGKTMLVWIANVSSFSCCVAYLIVSLAFIILRFKKPDMNRPFKVKFGKTIAALSIVLCSILLLTYLLPFTGSTFNVYEIIILLCWLVFGGLLLLYKKYIS